VPVPHEVLVGYEPVVGTVPVSTLSVPEVGSLLADVSGGRVSFVDAVGSGPALVELVPIGPQ
jgi:hypothetical protein